VTLGAPVIMGRKTWDSLPPRFRPLPGRRNIVVTRQQDWQATGAEIASSLEDAIALCKDAERAWVIGGAQLYAQAVALAQVAEVTEIEQDVDGDAFAPTLGPAWHVVAREHHRSATGLAFSFVTYQQTPHGD
jgi:dihydrofolate reductase